MFKKILFILFLVFSGSVFASDKVFLINTLAPSSELIKKNSSKTPSPFEQRQRLQNITNILETVIHSYDSLNSEEFKYLGSLRESIKRHQSEVMDLLHKIQNQFILNKKINPWIDFEIYDKNNPYYRAYYKGYKKHSSTELKKNVAPHTTLRVGILGGSFDPFHLGHLLMGLNHLANGLSDFIVYVPNPDSWINTKPSKPGKNEYEQRFKTVMNGGAEDMFPLLRVSTFGRQGDAPLEISQLISNNHKLINKLDKIEFNIIIGSDVLKRPGIIEKINYDYQYLYKMEKPDKIKITFHVIQRQNSELNAEDLAEIKKNFNFDVIVSSPVSNASSTQFREGPDNFSNFYPSSLPLLEPVIRHKLSKSVVQTSTSA